MSWEIIGALAAALAIGIALGGLRERERGLVDGTAGWRRVRRAGKVGG